MRARLTPRKVMTLMFAAPLLSLCLLIIDYLRPLPANAAAADAIFRGSEYVDDTGELQPGTGVLPARFALVIGINDYGKGNALGLGELHHPVSDADAMATALKSAGFEVTKLTSAAGLVTRNDILNGIEEFNKKISNVGTRPPILAFYYSGHGVSSLAPDGTRKQYLVPSDFHPFVAADVDDMAIPIEVILKRLGSMIPALRLVLIDACRSDVGSALSNGPNEVPQRFEAWQKFTLSDPAPKYNSKNGLLLAYAAAIKNGVPDDGAFSTALSVELERLRLKALASGTGRNASYSELIDAVQKAVQGANGNSQRIELHKDTGDFFIYSTETDRDVEVYNWELARQVAKKDTKVARIEFLCRIDEMRRAFSDYSYLSPLVAATLQEVNAKDCLNTSLNTTIDQNEALTDGAKIGVHKLSDTAPALGSVTGGALPKLDQSSSADNLAYGAYEAPIYAERSVNSQKKALLKEGDLVQLREGSDANFMAVKTTDGTDGYVERQALLTGRAAIDQTLQFREQQFNVAAADLHLNELLSRVVVSDAVVNYPRADRLLGLTRAQGVAKTLAVTVNGGRTANLITPRIVPVDADSPKEAQLEHGQVRLTLSVAPLNAEVRSALGSPLLTKTLALSNSIDITALAERLPEAGLPDRTKIASVAPSDSGPTVIPRVGSGLNDADICANQARNMPRPDTKSRVYIQISMPEQRKDYDVLAAGLRAAGYIVPAIDLQPPVESNEVRYCPGGRRKERARGVAEIIKSCNLATFSVKPLAANPNCARVKEDVVEVWFARH